VPRAGLACLLLGACSGTTVDLDFVSTPLATLTQLQLDVTSGGRSLLSKSFDGGTIQLPASLRLLVDVTSLDVNATAYDTSDGTRRQMASVRSLSAGTGQQVQIDLSEVSWCPAAPPSTNETVIYGDSLAAGFQIFPYDASAQYTETGDACSGARAVHYQLTGQAVDGLAIQASGPSRLRHVSLHLSASADSKWVVALSSSSDGAIHFLPTPDLCTNDQTSCSLNLTPQWQGFGFDVPDSVPATDKLLIAKEEAAAAVTVNVDDVRYVFAQ
jgi:hypothetical protein